MTSEDFDELAEDFMKVILYRIWQCTWGVLQTLLGLITFLAEKWANSLGESVTGEKSIDNLVLD